MPVGLTMGFAMHLVHKCFVLRNCGVLLRIFTVYVRSLLEDATCVWSPHYNCAIDKIEAVQRFRKNKWPLSLIFTSVNI